MPLEPSGHRQSRLESAEAAAVPDPLHASRLVRGLLWTGGVIALALGAVGVVLPGLPTTPFVLVAAACFLRASPRWHAWLLQSRLFGPTLREWEQHRSIPRRVKRFAIGSMSATAAFSIWYFVDAPGIQMLVAFGALSGAIMVIGLPSRD